MIKWFQTKVRYQKIDDRTGKFKMVNENYLVDAVSFTEAEARITEQMAQLISTDFSISAINKTNYTDIVNEGNGAYLFKVKIDFIQVDDSSGKESKASNYMLVYADKIEEVTDLVKTYLETMVVPYNVSAVSDSNILNIFPYFEKQE